MKEMILVLLLSFLGTLPLIFSRSFVEAQDVHLLGRNPEDRLATIKIRRLLDETLPQGADIHVAANDGAVVLTGSAENKDQEIKAIELANSVSNVRSVESEIVIVTSETGS